MHRPGSAARHARPRGETVQASFAQWQAASLALLVSFFSPLLFAENSNETSAWMSASAEVLTEEVASLPLPAPVLIAPVVKAPMVVPALAGRGSAEMKKLALKYDVTKIGERKVGAGMNFYSVEREIEIGREMSQEADQSVLLVKDPVINEYVNRVTQNLVRNSDAKVPFTVKVIQDEAVNAYALPGGFMYVNTGLILAADNEAQMAGVLAHEIAHVAARHATHNMSRRELFQLCTLPAVFVGGPAGIALREATQLAVPMQLMKFSRDAEREADLLGMEYAYVAGYDPVELVNFFEKVQAEEKHKPGFFARAFATHPMTGERVRRAQEEIETLLPAKNDYEVTSSEFTDVKARLSLLVHHQILPSTPDGKPVLKKRVNDREPSDDRPTLKRSAGN